MQRVKYGGGELKCSTPDRGERLEMFISLFSGGFIFITLTKLVLNPELCSNSHGSRIELWALISSKILLKLGGFFIIFLIGRITKLRLRSFPCC